MIRFKQVTCCDERLINPLALNQTTKQLQEQELHQILVPASDLLPHVVGGELEEHVVASRAAIVEIGPDTGLNRKRKGRINVQPRTSKSVAGAILEGQNRV